MNVTIEKYLSWENGEDSPTIKQLLTLANSFKIPFTAFYLPEAPQKFQTRKRF